MPFDSSIKKKIAFQLNGQTITIGRDDSCNLQMLGTGVSRVHASITCVPDHVTLTDKDSTFGTMVNNEVVKSVELANGSVITIGVNKLQVLLSQDTIILAFMTELETVETSTIDLLVKKDITIGRDTANTVCLSHPLVSRFHATIKNVSNNEFILEDHGSTNKTFVNGVPVRDKKISDGDIVQIGSYRFVLDNGSLQQTQDFNRIKIDSFNVSVQRGKHKILSNVSLSIEPGEFVAILGPSGAGKSTLANALTGQIPLSGGAVYYNGLPMRKFCSAFHSAIGFVSQQNMLRPELTVYETFKEQCLLRLPADSRPVEYQERIREVMNLLGLEEQSKKYISRLSGGQVKRVHFGMELLSSPTVIFLDEPLAGLDPSLTNKFMELFRSICDKGHTILLTTHTLEQLNMCDRVLFVANGSLVFSGSPLEMLATFKAKDIADVYDKAIKTDVAIAHKNESAQQKTSENDNGYNESVKLYKPKPVPFVKQIGLLVNRYATICLRDTRTLGLMLLQAPLIALLLGFVFDSQSSFLPLSFFFCITISVIWMGGMNSVREISREWPLLEREFRIGLSVRAYVLAKLFVFCFLATIQGSLFSICLFYLFPGFELSINNTLLLCAGAVSGTVVGLCISGLSRNVNMAISFLPIVFIPQIFFSGILMPFDEMPIAGRVLSYGTVSRPVFSMFKKMSFLDQSLWKMQDWKPLFLLVAGLIILLFSAVLYKRFIEGRFFK